MKPVFRRAAWLGLALLLIVASGLVGQVRADSRDARERVHAMYEDYRARSFSEIPDFEVDEARAFADSVASVGGEVVWLDVRASRERRVSVIPGAVDRQTYERHAEEWKERPVIVYCTIGYRSGMAARDLQRQGVPAWNLAGGILAWAHAGGEVVDGRSGQSTRRLHVYGWRWDLVPEGWKGVW